MGSNMLSEGKRGLYKNYLVAANNDKLSLSKSVAVNAPYEVNFVLNKAVLAVDSYILSNVALSQRIFIASATGILSVVGIGSGLLLIDGVSASNSTDLRLHVGSRITVSGLLTAGLDVDYLGGGISQSSDIGIIDATLDGEIFALNEARGLDFYGGNGTAGTRTTSHAGGTDYIDDVMIDRYGVEGGERSSTLIAANSDYLEISDSFTWTNRSDIDLEVKFYSEFTSLGTIFCAGGANNSGTGIVLLRRNTAASFSLFFSSKSNGNQLSASVTIADGLSTIKIKNLEIFVNGILGYTIVEGLIEIDSSIFSSTSGKLSYADSTYLSCDIHSISLNDKTFPLNEHNGATFYGDNGSTGQRLTSHAGGLNYINQEMIVKI